MIKFLKTFRSYFPGDIAKFSPAMEEDLVKAGTAVAYARPDPTATDPPEGGNAGTGEDPDLGKGADTGEAGNDDGAQGAPGDDAGDDGQGKEGELGDDKKDPKKDPPKGKAVSGNVNRQAHTDARSGSGSKTK